MKQFFFFKSVYGEQCGTVAKNKRGPPEESKPLALKTTQLQISPQWL